MCFLLQAVERGTTTTELRFTCTVLGNNSCLALRSAQGSPVALPCPVSAPGNRTLLAQLTAMASTERALQTLQCNPQPALPVKNIPAPDHRAEDIWVLPRPGAESWVQWQDSAKGQPEPLPGIPKRRQEWCMAWGVIQSTGLSEEMHHKMWGQQRDTQHV